MYRYFLILLVICYDVNCEDCVTVDFENGLEGNFTNTFGVCSGMQMWNLKQYSSLDMDSPHPKAASFISPQVSMSCMSSFQFTLSPGGMLEVNLYMLPTAPSIDHLIILVFQYNPGGNDGTIANVVLSASGSSFVP
ncbi:jg27469, partial [Pararge aegeria aegeria]